MATSRLPEITVTCREGHDFRTRAHGGQPVNCPECRAGGTRVKVWIRKDRPRTARELAEQGAIAPVISPGRPCMTAQPQDEEMERLEQAVAQLGEEDLEAEYEPEPEDDAGGLEEFLDLLRDREPGELGAGRYRLYKTPEGGLHLAYRPDHLGTDCHMPIPPHLLSLLRVMSKGPLGMLARRQARRALGSDPG